ncbi:MAG: L-2-amino-thiazoline-4-carboxylic acid hydrolase [Anaerolineae bacterium]|nr:L-2-amino-thiazoline-4-carboxylic acid hydrolase [Anaerolineae bacterium]
MNKMHNKQRKNWLDYMQWCRPLTAEKIGWQNYEHYYASSLEEFEKLLPDVPVFEQSQNNTNFHRGPFALSQYRTLLGEFGYNKESAFEILDAIVSEQCKQELEHSGAMRFFMGTMHKWPRFLVNKMLEKMNTTEENGWSGRFPEKEGFMVFDCTQCGLMIWLKEQGAPEICPVFCNTDYVTVSYMTRIKLIRTKTIGYGDDICDFRYYLQNQKVDENIKLK